MSKRTIGTRAEWLAARAALLEREKEHTRAGDELARMRRELPWVPLGKEYVFQGEQGTKTLGELFDGRSQLVVYHFMFGPQYEAGCPACSLTADGFDGTLRHLAARDVTMVCVSRAPIERLLAYRQRMGWSFEWVSSSESDFNFDFGVSVDGEASREPLLEANELGALKRLADDPAWRERLPVVSSQNASASGTSLEGYFAEGHGFSTFARESDSVYHCYSTYARGTEFLMTNYAILDHAPKGRDEGDQPMGWLRRHDEYALESSDR
jgi:predicted dithiol-disulfide oxidoreductase (DUF899 family)